MESRGANVGKAHLAGRIGFRQEYEQGLQERDNQITVGFGSTAVLPAQPAGMSLKGGLIFAGVDGAPTRQTRPQKAEFGLRVGFAYQYNETIRGGHGILWAPAIISLGPAVDAYGALGCSITHCSKTPEYSRA